MVQKNEQQSKHRAATGVHYGKSSFHRIITGGPGLSFYSRHSGLKCVSDRLERHPLVKTALDRAS